MLEQNPQNAAGTAGPKRGREGGKEGGRKGGEIQKVRSRTCLGETRRASS